MSRKTKTMTWLPVFGQLKPTSSGFTHIPLPDTVGTSANNATRLISTLAKNDQFFQTGAIEFKCKLNSIEDRVQIVLNQGLESPILAGLHTMDGAFGILSMRNNVTEPLALSGRMENLVAHKEYLVRVEAGGSLVKLLIDGVEICSAFANVWRSQVAVFVGSTSHLTLTEFKIIPQRPRAFVVMQFSQEFNELYSEVIKVTCEEFGFECIRGDDIYNNGLIIEDIAREIRDASVVIADVTPNNPNVFYEVGFSHGINKPTILLSDRKREKLPFDVAGYRTIYYDNTIGGKTTIQNRLREHLRNIKA